MKPKLDVERNLTLLTLMAAAAIGGVVHAQQNPVPSTINYQATLLQSDGKTPEVGPVDLEIRLYTNKGDAIGAAVWAEAHLSIDLFEGVFNVTLGEGTVVSGLPHVGLDTVFIQEPFWVGVKVVGETEERAERQQLVSAPYALTANTAITATHGVPVGTISVWTGVDQLNPPEGWLLCDGTALDATAESAKYAALYNVIQTTWGGTGESSFNVPNFGGRALMGNSGAAHRVGDLLGEEKHTLTVSELPSHNHSYEDEHSVGNNREGGDPIFDIPVFFEFDPFFDNTFRTTDPAGGQPGGLEHPTVAHDNMQPSIVMTFIIKY